MSSRAGTQPTSSGGVDAYIEKNNLLVNLLHDGYPPVSRAPCTARVADGDGVRSGRWAGRAKSECGLHV